MINGKRETVFRIQNRIEPVQAAGMLNRPLFKMCIATLKPSPSAEINGNE